MIEREDNTMKRKLAKNIYEQVPVVVTFCMTSKIGNPADLESFDEKFAGDFVKRLNFSKDSLQNCLKKEKNFLLKRSSPEELKQNQRS